MKLRLINLLMLALLLTAIGCSEDDVVAENKEIKVQDLTLNIDENPTNGQIIGIVETDGSGTLTFSIASQTPAGALNINSSTGELTVADATLFDFEINPVITATFSVAGAANTGTVTVNLNNLNELSVQNLTVTVDENPTNGQIVGTVEVEGDGPISFSIASQTPTGALDINTSTGELTVADAALFDFETNPVITATISVTGAANTGTVTIDLNDLNEISVQDLDVTIDENPTNGQVVGTVQVDGSGPFSFSIGSQSPVGALDINTSTGELTVANATLFDFETNPVITATISVVGALTTGSVTVNLNDLDDIESFLSTSQAAYIAASDGDWIIVTEAEYNSLAENLNAITRVGTTTAEYGSATSSALNGSVTASNATTTSLIPSNGYIIAFKYKIANASTDVSGFKIKQSSTANNSGFSDLGSVLPSHSGTHQTVFFVLKGNSTPVAANGYLGLFNSSSSLSLFDIPTSNGAYWGSSDTSNLNGQFFSNVLYQGLSTTQIQW